MAYQIQFKQKGKKRYYNFSHRILINKTDANKMMNLAKKDYPQRNFRLKSE